MNLDEAKGINRIVDWEREEAATPHAAGLVQATSLGRIDAENILPPTYALVIRLGLLIIVSWKMFRKKRNTKKTVTPQKKNKKIVHTMAFTSEILDQRCDSKINGFHVTMWPYIYIYMEKI